MRAIRVVSLLIVVIMLASMLAACGGGQPTPTTAPEATTAPAEATVAPEKPAGKVHKIGLVTDVGRVNDRSFNQSAWEGAQQAAKALGLADADVKYIETQDAKDYADNIQQFIDNGFDTIITVGFALGDATLKAAKANPKTNFIGVDQFQGEAIPNLTGLIFHEDQAGYLAGALAASLTESGKIAAVLGTDLVPPVVAFKEGYESGAKATKPGIQVISTFHPGEISQAFVDPEWGAATAKQALDQGADVVFAAGGQTGNGALQEVAVAAQGGKRAFCIGVDSDQWETVPAAHPCLVSSAMKLITPGVVDLVTMANEGKFPGGNHFGATGLAPFHDFASKVPADVQKMLEKLAADLKSGAVQTGYGAGSTEEPAVSDIGTEANPIKVFFVPSVEAGVITTGGEVMAQALEKATGLKFKVVIPTSYAATIEEMCASPTDSMGFIPGLGYVLANARCGVDVAFKAVRFGNDWYAAQYVVGRDSGINKLADLNGKKWAYPDAGSTSGYLYPVYQLTAAGVKPSESFAAGGHPQAIQAVYDGKADFATTFYSPPLKPEGEAAWKWGDAPDIPDALVPDCQVTADGKKLMCGQWRVMDARANVRTQAPDVVQKVKILDLTAQIPNDTLSFSPEFPAALRQQISDALLAFAKTDDWAKSIGSADFYAWSSITPATDPEYDPIRKAVEATSFSLDDLPQ